MKNVPEYLKEGIIEFNDKKVPIYPDSKLTALKVGLQNYYETYQIWIDNYYPYFTHFTQVQKPPTIILNKARGHDYLIRYFSSISFIHLSFEHFLIEILESKSPVLSRLILNNDNDLVKILSGNINDIDVERKNNINYSVALIRIVELIKNDNHLPEQFRIDAKYHFLLEHIKTLQILADLRNHIIHSGKYILNRYFYEHFFVNRLLPLIRKYINTQSQYLFIERNLACRKNVIDEICRYPLLEKYDDQEKFTTLLENLNRINHFKELGRASYKNPINMLENITNKEQQEAHENSNKRKREYAKSYVQFRQNILGHYKIHNCPCCGSQSLTTYDFWERSGDDKERVHTAECAICSYKVNLNIGEPKEFGIMNEEIFTFVD